MFHIEWQYLIFPRYDVYLEIIVIHFIRFVVKKKTEGKEYKLMFRNCIMPMKTNTILFFYLDDLLSSEYGTLQLAMLFFFSRYVDIPISVHSLVWKVLWNFILWKFVVGMNSCDWICFGYVHFISLGRTTFFIAVVFTRSNYEIYFKSKHLAISRSS